MSLTTEHPYWYALLVVPNTEFRVERELQKLGAQPIVPRVAREIRRHPLSKKTEVRQFPLWSRYVFAGFSTARPWYRLDAIPEITGAVGFEGQPMLLDRKTVAHVAEIAAEPIEIRRHVTEQRRIFKVGERVKIIQGPFRDHVAELSAIRRKSAELLLEIFGSIQGVSIPFDHIEHAAA